MASKIGLSGPVTNHEINLPDGHSRPEEVSLHRLDLSQRLCDRAYRQVQQPRHGYEPRHQPRAGHPRDVAEGQGGRAGLSRAASRRPRRNSDRVARSNRGRNDRRAIRYRGARCGRVSRHSRYASATGTGSRDARLPAFTRRRAEAAAEAAIEVGDVAEAAGIGDLAHPPVPRVRRGEHAPRPLEAQLEQLCAE